MKVCLMYKQDRVLDRGNALDDLEILKISVHVLQEVTDQSLLFIGLKIGDLMGFLSMFFTHLILFENTLCIYTFLYITNFLLRHTAAPR